MGRDRRHLRPLRAHPSTRATSTTAATVCCWRTRTSRSPAHSLHRSPFPGEKPKATTIKAAITWSGPATWSTAQRHCLLPAIPPHRFARSSILPSRSMPMAVSRKTSGWMETLTGAESNSTKLLSRSCWPGVCTARKHWPTSTLPTWFARAPLTSSAMGRSPNRSAGRRPRAILPPRLPRTSPR